MAQALGLGRWLSCCDSWGRRALVVLGELFRMESCGAAEVSFVLFTTSWPQFSFKARSCKPWGFGQDVGGQMQYCSKSFFDMRIRETDGVEFGVDVEDNDPTLSNIKQHHTTSRVSR